MKGKKDGRLLLLWLPLSARKKIKIKMQTFCVSCRSGKDFPYSKSTVRGAAAAVMCVTETNEQRQNDLKN